MAAVWTPLATLSAIQVDEPVGATMAHVWRPIEDLPDDWNHLVDQQAHSVVDLGRLVLRSRPEPTVVQGSEDADNPFFSPDSRWVGFAANGKLFKVPLEAVRRCSSPTRRSLPAHHGATEERLSSLSMLADSGGASRAVTPLEAKETTHRWPQALPGGEHIVPTPRTTCSTPLTTRRFASCRSRAALRKR